MFKKIPIPHPFRAFRYRNFRLFFFGQLTSVTGTWMQIIAQSWLVFKLTHSSFLLGFVGFAEDLPVFLFSLLGGVVADHYPKRKLIVLTQTSLMILAFTLAFLTLFHAITVNEIILLGILSGFAFAFDMPARQAFMIEMVELDALPSAIAMNSTAFNGARIFGPTLAAIILAMTNEGVCFLLNGISFLAVLWALLSMDVKDSVSVKERQSPFLALKEGLRYAYNYLPARVLLSLLSLISLLGISYSVLMPVFADRILHRGSSGLGVLMGSVGIGALAGAIYVGTRSSLKGMGKMVAIASSLFGTSLVLFALSRNYTLSIIILLFAGFGLMSQLTSTNTLLQTLVPSNLRGRLMSLYAMILVGLAPFGSLLAGIVAQRLGAPAALMIAGGICVIGAIGFAFLIPKIRPVVRDTLAAQAAAPTLTRRV